MEYYVTAWNPGNGAAFEAFVADAFQAGNLFRCACRVYLCVRLVRAVDHEVIDSYNNA
jgi:hypothetical protein